MLEWQGASGIDSEALQLSKMGGEVHPAKNCFLHGKKGYGGPPPPTSGVGSVFSSLANSGKKLSVKSSMSAIPSSPQGQHLRRFVWPVAIAICGFVVALSFAAWFGWREWQASEIKGVLQQTTKAARECVTVDSIDARWMFGKSIIRTNFNGKQWLQAVERIDVSRCPVDFRLAWRDFLDASGRAINFGFFDAIANTAGVLGGHPGPWVRDLQLGREADEAFRKLRRVAIGHGVDF